MRNTHEELQEKDEDTIKSLQEGKVQADQKCEEVVKECVDMKKEFEEYREKYEHKVSNKSRYEYQVRFMEVKCRHIASKSVDTETTEKNLEDKCKEMDDKLSFSDKKLKEEIEKNEVLT